MVAFLIFLLTAAVALIITLLFLWLSDRKRLNTQDDAVERVRSEAEAQIAGLTNQLTKSITLIGRLAKWSKVADAETAALELMAKGKALLAQATARAQEINKDAEVKRSLLLEQAKQEANVAAQTERLRCQDLRNQAQAALTSASKRATEIIENATKRAEEIAGEAYEAVRDASQFQRTARAMKNVIEGYGDQYIMPVENLLDELANDFSHKEAGQALKAARLHTKELIKQGRAACCDYVEVNRREGAERFVLDAFNGKVDSILSRVRHDNHGKLAAEIEDAFILVNYGGKAFRDARISDEYLQARLQELKWGAAATELKRQDQEEQRRIREQIREEEKARAEFERAMGEAAKEEETLRQAMAKARAQVAAASEDQKEKYQSQIDELNERLRQAEEKNQRALSMAQQTRRGHVYIISNIGSLGENVYKIGVTRRLDPLDRIRELGDSSVPFEFDVHAMILSDDAPGLEHRLHKHFVLHQVNKINHRKEFFRAELSEIRQELDGMSIEAKWTMKAEAAEYRESLAIERLIEDDPAAKEAWVNRQLALDRHKLFDLPVSENRGLPPPANPVDSDSAVEEEPVA